MQAGFATGTVATTKALALGLSIAPQLGPVSLAGAAPPRLPCRDANETLCGDGGPATAARLLRPSGVASDGAGGADGSTVLTLPGEDVFVNATIQGFKSRSMAMLASMYDADRRTRVRELSDVPVFQQHVEAPSDQSVVEFWLPAPPVNVKRYFVRVQVHHRGDGVLLGIADSRPIVAR